MEHTRRNCRRHNVHFILVLIGFLVVSGSLFASGAGERPPFEVDEAWARATAGVPRNGAAYLSLTNNTGSDQVLVAGETDVANTVEIHVHERNGDVMTMRPLPEGLTVGAGETVVLEPMGLHLMLIGLTDALEAGETFDIVLIFESGARVATEVEVRPLRD